MSRVIASVPPAPPREPVVRVGGNASWGSPTIDRVQPDGSRAAEHVRPNPNAGLTEAELFYAYRSTRREE